MTISRRRSKTSNGRRTTTTTTYRKGQHGPTLTTSSSSKMGNTRFTHSQSTDGKSRTYITRNLGGGFIQRETINNGSSSISKFRNSNKRKRGQKTIWDALFAAPKKSTKKAKPAAKNVQQAPASGLFTLLVLFGILFGIASLLINFTH